MPASTPCRAKRKRSTEEDPPLPRPAPRKEREKEKNSEKRDTTRNRPDNKKFSDNFFGSQYQKISKTWANPAPTRTKANTPTKNQSLFPKRTAKCRP